MVCSSLRHSVAWLVAVVLLLTAAWSSSVAQSGRKRETAPRQYEPAKPKSPPPSETQEPPATPSRPRTVGQPDAPQSDAPRNDDSEPDDTDENTLRIQTQLVTVPFAVVDKRNRYINDLTAQDVQVLENGKPQEIFSFTREHDLPLTFALVFDISGSQQYSIAEQRLAAKTFLRQTIRPEKDLAGVVTFRRDIEVRQKLTSNLAALERAVDDVRFESGGYVYGGTPPLDPSITGTSLYDAVYVISSEMLPREAGRRVIILLTDGEDTTSRYKLNDAIDMALRSDVQVYAVGIPGGVPNGFGGVTITGIDRRTLERLCEATGGRAFFPRSPADYVAAFQQIETDLRQQYILTYVPSDATRDGSFRSITIKILRSGEAKDWRIFTRKGYYAK
ncbi:VWA domain-containing protein [Chloracidobacterium thermophilum]|uniref:VWA domain-containing protein n=1 Tax=Chloracidobacterium thermophilum TaxID=458033 RepID=UPI0003113CE3|nr:VWA domain-containing protein [Chloracidobacterium thermophilum]QUV79757.1 VWA domain-containing protein [Chloracidobacterium thermophilum]